MGSARVGWSGGAPSRLLGGCGARAGAVGALQAPTCPLPPSHRFPQVYLADWLSTQVAVKVLIVGHVANASDAQRALTLSTPILHKLEAEASLLASLRCATAASQGACKVAAAGR